MLTAARFTRAKTQKQPNCPLRDEWTQIWYKREHPLWLTDFTVKQRPRPHCKTTNLKKKKRSLENKEKKDEYY